MKAEGGLALLSVLLTMIVVVVIATAIMGVVRADVAAGIRQQQAVQVFNVAEAGVDYAIARLQQSGARNYAGAIIPVSDPLAGQIGQAQVTVQCMDGSSPATVACRGPHAAFRRVRSTGTLNVAGPARVVTAVVQGLPDSAYSVCGYESVTLDLGSTAYGDVGSNGTIDLRGAAGNYSRVRRDPPPPFMNYGYYSGSARATGAVNCSQGCAVQVEGTTTANTGLPVCPTMTLPPFSPGAVSMTVTPLGWTMDPSTGYNWRDIVLQGAGTSSGCTGATPFTDLVIQTGPAGTTAVVNVRRLTIGRCGRVIVLGDGDLDLRVGEPNTTALTMGQYSRFGVLPTDTYATPAPTIPSRIQVSVLSSANPAVQIDRAAVVVGTFRVPNGGWSQDQAAGAVTNVYGTILARTILASRNISFVYDIPFDVIVNNFRTVRSWKDQ